ncbi:SDR family NAD(P)-dependent oxidoreductase [Micromonospora sp. DT233]|uniref:SDR family NAD(P)-dependent oxidoreductase n=1 Tax=Micromonospora sp. DT233 TaxID=3393432 RepID=UPI003CEECEF5
MTLDMAGGSRPEPVAIVGLSCRLPGAADPAAFWRLLRDGTDAVTEVPAGREPVGGRWGGFLDDVEGFDAGFFGITPREAAVLDPQQRLALELAWEALEDARIVPDELRHTAAGVFVGAMRDDYATLLNRGGAGAANHHAMPGVSRGVIANRVSHVLGLHGPSLVIDAGQASSLVAVHHAVHSLRRGETSLAIAGGVNLNLARETGAIAEEFGGLSPDGRCHTFDARANGFVRGEGGAVVVLKLLSEAVAAGDRVHAVILGGAVNHDGTTEGIAVPSRQAQADLLRQAYASAALPPDAAQYVELHGTGTPVGDPIEAAALGAALGTARERSRPLLVGSVKTNLGHLEGAAGITGLLKAVLSLTHRRIPATLHHDRPHPDIPLAELNLRVVRELTEWPATDGPRVAGVSAFGMGGTNCHLVLAEAPTGVDSATTEPGPAVVPWLLSARSSAALGGQARALAPLAGVGDPLGVGWSLVSSRSRFERRAVVVGDHAAGLAALAAGEPAGNVVSGVAGGVGRVVFVFPGQGAQWVGMGAALLDSSPVFAGVVSECAAVLSGLVDWSLVDVLRGTPDAVSLGCVDVVQPASFVVMVGLAAVWRSFGVRPAAVVGHSQGEVAAACVAGALSLADALRVVVARSRAVAELCAGEGAMASVRLPAAEVRVLLAECGGAVGVAAVNSPSQVVVSGEVAAVERLLARCERDGVRARRIAVDYASHSPAMDVLADRLAAELADVTHQVPQVPWLSTVTGEYVEVLGPGYWFRNLRESVGFADGIARLAGEGHGVFVEVSSHPVLTSAVEETVESLHAEPAVVTGTLRRDDGGPDRLLASIAEVWVRGVDVDWTAAFPATRPTPVDLPTYAFQRRRHWFDTVAPEHTGDEPDPGSARARLAAAGPAERRRMLLDLVRSHAAAILGHGDAGAVPARTALRELGVDSQSALRLRHHLGAALGVTLPTTVLFDHPTAARLAEHLDTLVDTTPVTTAPAPTPPVHRFGATDEPIAIVGMGCRLPGGVHSPEQLWDLLSAGTDAVSPFPTDRGWDLRRLLADPDRPGGSTVAQGGFLHDAGDFDPEFFGISPREALAMDPQQRLLLETSWEALERAGIDPSRLAGSRTGVFVGAMAQEYGPRMHEASDGLEGYLLTGTTGSTMSGRIAYVLGLEGPALTVDTACSAALVAIHLAVRSLRSGECALALAGAATVMARPGIFVEFSRQRGLAPDGRVKAFSEHADGTGWGEGVGTIVLERLSDARRNGHPVLAVLAGTAVNSDGASNGLTAPNGLSQQRVIRQALADAGLRPAEVDAVEAHGTGTVLGDPIEAGALIEVYGRDRTPEQPLWLGSLKTNIGHTQAAAGLAGVIKMVESLRRGLLPRSLHADPPSSHVDWSAGTVRLLTEARPWPAGARPRRAGVSAFGVSGTNAHVVLAEAGAEPATPAAPPTAPDRPAGRLPYLLSARTPQALAEQARLLRARLRGDDRPRPVDLAYTLATGRARFDRRAVFLADDLDDLDGTLAVLADGGEAPHLAYGGPAGDDRVVFVFPGQGGQWPGMATELLDAEPVFADRMADCERALSEFVDWSLTDVLRGVPGAPTLDRVDVVQPALFATMVSLAALWQSHGVRPAAVLGHSQGEIAAACVAGALSLRDAARVVALRSRALRTTLAGQGTMASVLAPAETVRALIARWDGRISVAAINGPRSVVVSGDTDAVADLLAECAAQDLHARAVPVDYASHSAQVETLRDDLTDLLAPVRPRRAEVPFWSTVTATALDGTELDADYWYRNLRGTVRFDEVTGLLAEAGHRVFVEVSPHPTLTTAVGETLEHADARDGVAVGSLRRGDGGPGRFRAALAQVYAHGVEPDWDDVFAGHTPRRVELPTYPFQRQRYWWTPPAPTAAAPIVTPDGPDWRYEVVWRPVPTVAGPLLTGRWLVVAGARTATSTRYADVLAALREHGADVVPVLLPDDASRPAALAPALAGHTPAGVLSLLALDGPDDPVAAVADLAALLRELDAAHIAAPLWCATRHAVRVTAAEPAPELAQAALWAAGRAAAVEHPRGWGGLVDLPDGWDRRAGQQLVAVLAGTGGEDQVAVRPSGAYARRLQRATAGAAVRSWRAHGTVLVTGGTGALGVRLARWLAGRGAQRIVLLSRRGADAPEAGPLAADLAELGVALDVTAADVTDRAALADVLAGIDPERPLTAVFHAAGVCELDPVTRTDAGQLTRVLAAKVTGAVHLDELLADTPLDAFVLFSSISATWGVAEHAAYGAANACLDALAHRRRARGGTATSIAWGPWGGGGMIDPGRWSELAASGLPVLDADRALDALQVVLDHDETTPVVADVDWDRFVPVYSSSRPSPLLADLAAAPGETDTAAPVGALGARLAALPEADQRKLLADLVRQHTAAVLGHADAGAVAADRAFKELGFDSLTAVELRNRLAAATDLRLPTTLVFDHPTPDRLARHLWQEALGRLPVTESTRPAPVAADEPLAVVGMACRLPGDVARPDDLWRLLRDGVDAVGGLPTDRGWDLDVLYDPDADRPGTSYTRAGGFLGRAAEFDHDFFGISAREALAMDPQQRLLLEASWEAFEDAGLVPADLRGSDTGVFAGVLASDYGQPHGLPGELEGYRVTGGAPSVASGRLAYSFGFTGPALTVDTACSSSLVALHLAARALRAGECDRALVAGAAVMSTPDPMISFSRQRALSKDGRCRSFADDADGFGMAEGVAVLVVERLSDARRDGHRVLAVVRGSAVNQDGASNGLTAPNGPSQQRVIRQALVNAGVSASDVDVVEAHGTGTSLGDPIEAQAVIATYGQDRPADRPLWLGSVKSNIGHTQSAAGLVGVLKMVLALRHGVLPRSLHAARPSSRIDWTAGAVRLLDEERDWPRTDRPRRAGVSAFGISGTNAHVIVEEAPVDPAPPRATPTTGPAVVPWLLSARSSVALGGQAEALVPLAGVADSLAVGWSLVSSRSRFERRAVVVGDHAAGLAALAAGEPAGNVVSGVAGGVGRPVFVFPGQGAQWVGMGAALLDSSPVFARVVAECAVVLSDLVDWSVVDVLRGDAGGLLGRVDVVQPASFVVMVGLAAVWRSFGVEPAAVVGHSQGEVAAACVAGVLSLSDALRVVVARSRAVAQLCAGLGAMASVRLSAEQVGELLTGFEGRVGVAAVNSPSQVVVSGEVAAVERLLAECERVGVRARRIAVDYASHSPAMDVLAERLAVELVDVTHRVPQVPWLSTVTGEYVEVLGPGYWFRNLRESVGFADGIARLAGEGHGVFVEVSSHPVLTSAVEETVEPLQDAPVAVTGTLRRDDGGLDRFLLSAGALWVHGVDVDWTAAFPAPRPAPVDLPTYAFRRVRHWIEPPAAATARQEAAQIDGWRYRLDWVPVPTTGDRRLAGTWLLVTPRADVQPDLVDAVADGLTAHGATVCRRTAAQLATAPADLAGVLSLAALDEAPHPEQPEVSTGLADTVTVVRALAARAPDVPFWTATQNAVGTGADDPVRHPTQAQLWGLGVVLGIDDPHRHVGQLDLPAVVDDTTVARLAETLAGTTGESEVAVRGDLLLGRRLVPAPAGIVDPWQPRGTVLITGGTGALGAHVARWAAANGAAHLVLTSRRGADAPGAKELHRELAGLGAQVTIAACDVADADDLAAVLAAIPADEPLTAVVHAAGVTQPEIPVGDLTPDVLAPILRVKVDGARNLDALTADVPLDAFVLFSSGAGTWGDSGKGGYAAANAHLDALAHQRRSHGRPATSIAWGAWAGGGMVEGEVADLLTRRGVRLMRPDSAVRALATAVGAGDAAVAVASFDLSRFLPLYTMTRPRRLVDQLWATTAGHDGDAAAQPGPATGENTLAARLAGQSAEEQEAALTAVVRREVAAVLKAGRPEDIPPRRAFKELGFDSLTALELRNRLATATGLRLPATLVFDHPSPAALARHLRGELTGGTRTLLADLDRFEADLAALPEGDPTRAGVVERLRALLLRAAPTAGTEGVEEPPDDLSTVSDDEIFEMIDRELGI